MKNYILLFSTALVISACGTTEDSPDVQSNEDIVEKTDLDEKTVIELESNEDMSANVNFNQNSSIDSEIYKEFFFSKELLEKKRMDSDTVDNNKVATGNQLPISTEYFPAPYYMDYTFNMVEEKLDLALILTEGSVVKEEELMEDVFVYLVYNNGNDALIDLTQENANGDEENYIDLTEEEWGEVAQRYIDFVNSIN